MESQEAASPQPVPSTLSATWLGKLKRLIKTTRRVVLYILVFATLFYLYREVTHDALVIDPFTVPKSFDESGLTPEVLANRIRDAIHQIEVTTQTTMKKDKLALLRDERLTPDVEISGTKLGLKTLVELIRALFTLDVKHISGDIVVRAIDDSSSTKPQAFVTVYITEGRKRSLASSFIVAANDTDLLAQRTAEIILANVNPYILALYRYDRHDNEQAAEIAQRIIEDHSQSTGYVKAAYSLWGNVLADQKKYDHAETKYRKAIEIDPKSIFSYVSWGIMLQDQKKYDDAEAKYKKAIEIDPKFVLAYSNWGAVLYDRKKYDDAETKYRKAIEIDPKFVLAYNNWGNVLAAQKKYDDAEAKYKKAIEIDPKSAVAYTNCGNVFADQKKSKEAE